MGSLYAYLFMMLLRIIMGDPTVALQGVTGIGVDVVGRVVGVITSGEVL